MLWRDECTELRERLVCNIFKAGGLKFGEFTLVSGLKSPYYIDERELLSSRGKASGQELAKDVTEALYLTLVNDVGLENVDLVIGVPDAVVPYIGCLTYAYGVPSGYTVKIVKKHGIPKYVQGKIETGDRLAIMDDLITSGGSIVRGLDERIAKQCEQDKIYARVDDAVVLVDRLQGGVKKLEGYVTKYSPNGIAVHSFMSVLDMIDILHKINLITDEQHIKTKNYIENPPTK